MTVVVGSMVVVGAIVVSGAAVAGTVSAIVEEVTDVSGSVAWVLEVSSPHPAAANTKAKLVMILIPVLVIACPRSTGPGPPLRVF
ncbi:MAG: hypothetical protein MUP76_01880 [Acidimicrobiia bacterium]|nr:hypothetical protein [Acidimicrobiia bacterium]